MTSVIRRGLHEAVERGDTDSGFELASLTELRKRGSIEHQCQWHPASFSASAASVGGGLLARNCLQGIANLATEFFHWLRASPGIGR